MVKTDISKIKSGNAPQRVTDLCALGVILLGGLTLFGWLTGLRLLTSVLADYIPMAVSTAVSFIFVGSLLLWRRHSWAVKHNFFLAIVAALFTMFQFINLLIYLISNGNLTVDAILFPSNEVLQTFPVNRMSPITGATFFISALAVYLLFRAQASGGTAHGTALLGFVVFEVGSISVMGYLYGTPLLYGGPTIPLALTTTLAFTFLGVGLITASGANNIILRLFTGPLLRARLLRTFLPISVLLILAQGYLHRRLDQGNINPALWDTLVSVVFAALMGLAIIMISRVVAQAVDRAQAERQKAEHDLQTQYDFALQILNNMGQGLTVINNERRFEYVNPAYARLVGYTPEELLGKSPFDVTAHVDHAVLDQAREQRLRGETSTYETRLLHADGREIPVTITGVPRWREGKVSGAVAVITDLTERKHAEEKQKELSRERDQVLARLQLIMDRMPVICVMDDKNFRVEYWNKAAERVFGYAAEEMVGKVSRDILVPPSARAYVESIHQHVAVGDMNTHGINENLTKDGHVILCEWINTPLIDERGNFIGYLAMAQDVTERKKAEDQLRQLSRAVEQSPVSIVISNTRGDIQYVNPKFKDLSGYTAAEIIGQNPRLLKSGYTSDEEYKILWKTISEGKEWRGKFLNKKKNGELYWESASISAIVNEAGEITHYLAVKEDITEREQREQELEAIAAISLALRAAPARKEMLPIILDQLHRLFQSDGEAISLIDPLSNGVVVELGRGAFASTNGIRMPAGQGVSGLVIQSGRPYLSNDVQHDPNFVRKDILQEINAFACAPLNTHDTTLGLLWIGRATDIIPTEVRVLVAIADIAANAMHRAALHEQTKKQLEHLTALRAIDAAISNNFDLRVTLNIFIDQVLSQLKVHAASVLISKEKYSLEYAAGGGFRNPAIKKTRLRFGEGHAGRAALERRPLFIPDLSQEPFPVPSVLASEGFVFYYAAPLIAKGEVKGVLQIFHRAPLSQDEEWFDFVQMLAGQAAIAIDDAALFDHLQQSNAELIAAYDATIEGWSRALDLRDQETEGHTQRVTEMALKLAAVMGVEETQLMHLQRGALLHDIGKMGIPDSILLKPGPLNEQEMEIMRRHPQYAYDLLTPIPFLRPSLDIPYCHHEKWDGTGYPRKLKGEQIPLVARIFAVVDVWDALISDRPYRAAWSRDKVRAYIREQSGLYFEPRVVEIFLKMIETH